MFNVLCVYMFDELQNETKDKTWDNDLQINKLNLNTVYDITL